MSVDTRISLGRGTILIIDDDDGHRRAVRRTLEQHGWTVLVAGDGAAGLARYEQSADRIGLVLLDLVMPVMSGEQFAALYWELDGEPHGHAPLVVMAGTDAEEAARSAERLGAAGFLRKPVDPTALAAVAERCARPARRPSAFSMAKGWREPSEPDERHQPRPEGRPEGHAWHAHVMRKPTPDVVAHRRLERLLKRVHAIRDDLDRAGEAVREIAQREATRSLTREEARWASRLRLESEALRCELQLVREEFADIRHTTKQ